MRPFAESRPDNNGPGSRVLYIAGAGHSGSSLMDVVLGGHPETISTGEVHRVSITPETRECSCHETVANCVFWSQALDGLKTRISQRSITSWTDFSLTAFQGRPSGCLERLGEVISRAALVYGKAPVVAGAAKAVPAARREIEAAARSWTAFDSMAEQFGVRVIIDSTKTPARMCALRFHRPDDVYVLHLVRDGRAVAASDMRRTGAAARAAAKAWASANRKAELSTRNIRPKRLKTMRYEDFCDDPSSSATRIFEWLGLTPTGHVDLPSVGDYHAIPGNPMLLSGIDAIRKDEGWRRINAEQVPAPLTTRVAPTGSDYEAASQSGRPRIVLSSTRALMDAALFAK